MGLPATASTGSAQLILLLLFLLASLHLSGAIYTAPAPAAVASPFSFSFDFTNASSYRLDNLKLEGDAAIPLGRGMVDVTCNSWGKDPTSCKGRVSYGHPVPFYDATTGEVASFQTRFTFTINTTKNKGDGMAFFLAYYPSELPPNSTGGHLGLISQGDQERGAALGNQQFVAVPWSLTPTTTGGTPQTPPPTTSGLTSTLFARRTRAFPASASTAP
uniref:Agglutinin-2 n=1 Tax=Aegilops tauschii TaxID=37682 RepID=M8C665_AEGTA